MYRTSIHIFSILLTFSGSSLLCSQAAAIEPAHQQAQRVLKAVGKVLLREQLTQTLLQSCSANHAHLRSSAENSQRKWQDSNRETLIRTRRVQKSVIQTVNIMQSPKSAETLTQEIDDLIKRSVKSFKQEIENKPRKERHYICNRLILSISAGDWDLQRQVPKAVKQITDFK